jgi:predicted component of type VI protein secretion system
LNLVENTESNTFLNDLLVEKEKQCPIAHGDRLRLGGYLLSLHIHAGSNTCVKCEPGEMVEYFKKLNSNANASINDKKENFEAERRKQLKSIKKK